MRKCIMKFKANIDVKSIPLAREIEEIFLGIHAVHGWQGRLRYAGGGKYLLEGHIVFKEILNSQLDHIVTMVYFLRDSRLRINYVRSIDGANRIFESCAEDAFFPGRVGSNCGACDPTAKPSRQILNCTVPDALKNEYISLMKSIPGSAHRPIFVSDDEDNSEVRVVKRVRKQYPPAPKGPPKRILTEPYNGEYRIWRYLGQMKKGANNNNK